MPSQLPNPWDTPLMTVAQAGQVLGVSRSVIYKAVADGQLEAVQIGATRMIKVAPLYALLHLPMPARPGPPPTT